jgi:membrane protease YdiL (CAAX protease family)
MRRTGEFFRAVWSAIWTGGFAVALTALVSGVWSGLLLANLKIMPAIPWSVAVMALLLGGGWAYLSGSWGSARTRMARRALLRATPVSPRIFAWALCAGILSIVSLAGFWIVLFQLVKMPGNTSDFSALPAVTVIAALAMASLAGAVSEEAGFRGYFQGTLERHIGAPFAIALTALLMMPEHASTQGFVWPTLLFYLLVDTMLGVTAYLTQSILPGIAIHAIGLLTFFGLVWPHDKARLPLWTHGADEWFWIHAGQAFLFAVLALVAFRRLSRITSSTLAFTQPLGASVVAAPAR